MIEALHLCTFDSSNGIGISQGPGQNLLVVTSASEGVTLFSTQLQVCPALLLMLTVLLASCHHKESQRLC